MRVSFEISAFCYYYYHYYYYRYYHYYYYYHYYFIASWRCFLTYIYSNFESTFFGLSSLEVFLWIPLCIIYIFHLLFCLFVYICIYVYIYFYIYLYIIYITDNWLYVQVLYPTFVSKCSVSCYLQVKWFCQIGCVTLLFNITMVENWKSNHHIKNMFFYLVLKNWF